MVHRIAQEIEAALAAPGEIRVSGSPRQGRGIPAGSAGYHAARRLDRETQAREGAEGMSPPWQADLDIGRGVGRLYWSRLSAEYRKPSEARLREQRSASALRVELSVSHAPDDHTPYVYLDWPDPMDVRGATALAKKLVEEGGAQYSEVTARASRSTSRRSASDRGVVFHLASFERATT